MLSNKLHRSMILLLVLVMVFSIFPTLAVAIDPVADPTVSSGASEPSETYVNFQTMIGNILTSYLGADFHVENISTIVKEMDDETIEEAWLALNELEQSLVESCANGYLTEDEAEQILEEDAVFVAFGGAVYERISEMQQGISLFATALQDKTVLDGKITISVTWEGGRNAASISQSGNTVTIKAPGGSIYNGQTEATVTIRNTSGTSGTLRFHYKGSNYDTFSHSASSEDDIVESLGTTDKITMKIKGKNAVFSNTAQLVLSNFEWTEASGGNITFDFDESMGKIKVGGTEYTAPPTSPIAVSGSDGIEVEAIPTVDGVKFVGWWDPATNKFWSDKDKFTFNPESDMTLRAEFAEEGDTAFIVGERFAENFMSYMSAVGIEIKEPVADVDYATVTPRFLYPTLNEALAAAAASDKAKIVVPTSDFTLAQNTTIPAGVTLLIPFDDARTLYTTGAVPTEDKSDPTRFCTMTIAAGKTLTINGTLSVSGQHYRIGGDGNGLGCTPTGPQGFIHMNANSKITVNAGGTLCAYGYIEGDGSVEVMGASGSTSGGVVYELFQVTDFRGGKATTTMDGGKASDGTTARTFPLSQYYLQNVQVPMTLHYGATEKIFTSITMANGYLTTVTNAIAPSNSLFIMNDSTAMVVKDYIEETDRQQYDLYGNITFANIELTLTNSWVVEAALKAAGLPSQINSADYIFPITSNMDVTQHSGTLHVKQNVVFIPGSHLTIAEGATVKLYSGYEAYVYDVAEWGAYVGPGNAYVIPVANTPNKGVTRTADGLENAAIRVDGILDISGSYIYTTSSGANIYSKKSGQVIVKEPGTEKYNYQAVQSVVDGEQKIDYVSINIAPAWLRNCDDTFVKTGQGAANTYTYIDGFWRCQTHSWDMTQYECGVCSEPAIRYDAINLSIEGEVKLNLKFKIADQLINEGLVVHVSEQENSVDTDGDSWENTVTREFLDKKDKTRHVIQQGIAAGEMPGNVTVYFTHGEKTVPIGGKDNTNATTEELTQSVKEYLVQGLNSDKQTLKELCKWTAIYGGYAQEFFMTDKDYKNNFVISDLVDDWTPDSAKLTQQATISGSLSGISAYTQRINLDSEIYMRTYFLLDEGQSIDNFNFELTDTPDSTSYFVGPEHESGNKYYVDIKNIPVASWNDMYTITVSNDSGSFTVTSSVLAWAARCVNSTTANQAQKNMAMAMGYYAEAADNYFQ